MGGKSKGINNQAAIARADEQERQARIRAGTERVNSIFDGGATTTRSRLGADAAYDPTKSYLTADGTPWTPNTTAPTDVGSLGDAVRAGGSNPADQFRAALGGGLFVNEPTQSTGGFSDQFYSDRRKAFLDYANPQLDEQYGEANKQLTYSLARSGLLDSSVRAEKGAELQKKYDLNKQQIADQALSYETEARTNVEKARSDLITMLNATGDAEGAASSALARSQALSAPQAFSPLTQLFADFTGGLAQQAGYERANALGGSGVGQPQIGRYNTGLFSNAKSVSVKN